MRNLAHFAVAVLALFLAATAAHAQAQIKHFRGELGDRTITMSLRIDGPNVSGMYAYDGIGQSLTLQGHLDAKGGIRLDESDAAGKRTGQFAMEMSVPDPQEDCTTLTGSWKPPGKSDESLPVHLTKQDIAFSIPTRIKAKMIVDRKHNIHATYPQIVGATSPAVAGFNRAIAALLTRHVADFKDDIAGATIDHWSFEADYDVLLGTEDLMSVEIFEDVDYGGPHTARNYFALTWDLRTGKEIQFADIFQPESNYLPTVLEACARDIDQQSQLTSEPDAVQMGVADLERSFNGKWGLTRHGVFVYFDFPYVIFVLSKTFVPFREIEALVNPASPAGRFLSRHR